MTDTGQVGFVDVETIRLKTGKAVIWEVGLIVDDVEHVWLLPVALRKADPMSLAISGFHDRHPWGNNYPRSGTAFGKPVAGAAFGKPVADLPSFARHFARLTHLRHLVGAVVSFDEERLRLQLVASGVQPSWHYHIIDVEALAVGYAHGAANNDDGIGGRDLSKFTLPWKSHDLSGLVGVDRDRPEFAQHTAIGDARWAKAIYEAVVR